MPADEIPAATIGAQIDAAVAAASAAGIAGKDVTPYLLDKLLTLTGGASLTTNIALIKSNACACGADCRGSPRARLSAIASSTAPAITTFATLLAAMTAPPRRRAARDAEVERRHVQRERHVARIAAALRESVIDARRVRPMTRPPSR